MFHLFPEYKIGQSITTWEWATIILKILSITSVPYYLSQSGARVKCPVSDSRHGITYCHLLQAGATGKSKFPDSRHGITYCHLLQAAALGKCPFPDSRYGIGYDDGIQ